MTGRVEGKVAFITGAGRGQGRSHAIKFAEEGADIIAVDIASQIDTVPFAMGTSEDLAETVRLVQDRGRRIVASAADVRDFVGIKTVLDAGVAEFGRLDIVVANAGIFSFAPVDQLSDAAWADVIAVNLTGVWHTVKAAVPHLPRKREWIHHHHRIDRRCRWAAQRCALRGSKAWNRRDHEDRGSGAGEAEHPRQFGPPRKREYADAPESGTLRAVLAGSSGCRADA